MKLLLVGATGLVGSHVLDQALLSGSVEKIIAPVRREFSPHPKLEAPVVDFENLPEDASWWDADAVICALGTTIGTAGTKDRFRRVDHDYPLMVARIAKARGVETYVLNSALGADPDSRFLYTRTKGELERDLEALGFRSLTLVRPGLIGGDRKEFRLGERVGSFILNLLGPVLPKAWRVNPAETIAAALIQSALEARAGTTVVSSDKLC